MKRRQNEGGDIGRRIRAAMALSTAAGILVARFEWAWKMDGQLLTDRNQKMTADVVFRDRIPNPFVNTTSRRNGRNASLLATRLSVVVRTLFLDDVPSRHLKKRSRPSVRTRTHKQILLTLEIKSL